MIVKCLASLALAYIGWNYICLQRNLRKARTIGVPVLWAPIDGSNVLWMTFQPLLWNIIDRLPFDWLSYPPWFRMLRRGWHFRDKSILHRQLGPAWAVATPFTVHLQFADAEAICEIYARRRDFIRPIVEYKLLEVFGPCLSTAGWEDWPRHRKPSAAPFNEGIMKFVWKETVRQGCAMMKSWESDSATRDGIPSTAKDSRTLSLNILAAIGFGQSYSFQGSSDDPVVGEATQNYRDALATVLDNVILIMLVPLPYLKSALAPKSWAKIGEAADTFQGYMRQMVKDEQDFMVGNKSGSGAGIMTAFLHANKEYEAYMKVRDPALPDIPKNRKGLTINEVYSNLFVINFAGHDTTANSLAFTMFLLAAYPNLQEWLAEEINAVVGNTPVEEWDYQAVFPKLNRCRAVLYEVLRLFPPIVILPKWTAKTAQKITVRGKQLYVPEGINTNIYVLAVQTMPEYWEDPLTWKPSRWIVGGTAESSPGNEDFFQPIEGSYIPWSAGVQNCPGKKFAEVEAVVLTACLFQKHRISVMRRAGESAESAQLRALHAANSCDQELLLRMVEKDDIRLVYTKK